MADKTKLSQSGDVTKASGASSKTVSVIRVYEHGSVVVFEATWSDATVSYWKVRGFQVEAGGTNDFGTGTTILG